MRERRSIERSYLQSAGSGNHPQVGGGANPIDPIEQSASSQTPGEGAVSATGAQAKEKEQKNYAGKTPGSILIGPKDPYLDEGDGGETLRTTSMAFTWSTLPPTRQVSPMTLMRKQPSISPWGCCPNRLQTPRRLRRVSPNKLKVVPFRSPVHWS